MFRFAQHDSAIYVVSFRKFRGVIILLVGWVAEYDAPGRVRVGDSVNGPWKRAGQSLAFQNDGGDIALYYLESSRAAPSSAATL